ncbi:hypothetical protein ACFQ0K_11780 [Nocardioides caeni]|uniref:Uncharacterized protein n=1 Tax=Nocardioides caeni TaxID=574700 RepID=A0A4S8NMR4_9ACTN|nr:hypothetical protein [Nocardioides caeni]THV17875.1 hypothetical protein E9934_05295 [Nocardioides caeni]
MRFTEHELTAALAGAAKTVLAADRKVRRSGVPVDEFWDSMDRYQRFKLLDSLGSQVLPVLVALPDVDVEPGTRPAYSDKEVADVIAGLPGQEGGGRIRRAALLKVRTALVQAALAAVPPRLDPDALIVPDHL